MAKKLGPHWNFGFPISKKNKANFCVNLIPETLTMTNLNKLRVGSLVNLELDQNTVTIVDTVKSILAKKL